jgi:thymidylate synthase (FAD)
MTTENKRKVLDKGFVECQEIMGDELLVVNSARVSFGKSKSVFEENDQKLLRYLIRNQHFSPFRHVLLRFHIKAPEFVMRQWFKHIIGCEWTTSVAGPGQCGFHAWNEISGRYVEMEEVYIPSSWRRQSKDNKQGSERNDDVPKDHPLSVVLTSLYQQTIRTSMDVYKNMLESGIAREQARILLPFSLYTETIWTASFQAVMHFLSLRLDVHAQFEIRQYADAIYRILLEKLPVLAKMWLEEMDTSMDAMDAMDYMKDIDTPTVASPVRA